MSENCVRFFSGIRKRASGDPQSFQLLPNLTVHSRHEAVPHLSSIDQLVTIVITDDHGIEGIARRIPTNDELLRFVDLVFGPRTGIDCIEQQRLHLRAMVLKQVEGDSSAFVDGDDFAVEQGTRRSCSHALAMFGNYTVKLLLRRDHNVTPPESLPARQR